MKKKIATLLAVGLFGLTASAEVMYWQVNNSDSTVAGSNYDSAYLVATPDGGTTKYYVTLNMASDGTTQHGAAVDKATFSDGGYAIGDLSSLMSLPPDSHTYNGGLSSLSFFLELRDANNAWVAETAPLTYGALADAVSSGFNSDFSGVNNALGSAGSGATYTNVPEPTSGLLMLVGFGALALRRRKVA